MNDTVDISIIIPVYHTDPAQLRTALASVTSLTVPYECVVVFDGEPEPALADVVNEFDETYVRALMIEHAGVSVARNAGIEAAHGRWLTFLDSDDRLIGEGLESLVRFGVAVDCQIVQGVYLKESNGMLERCALTDSTHRYAGEQGLSDFMAATLEVDRGVALAWSKIYDRGFILQSGVRFDPALSVDEDTLFVLDAVAKADAIGFNPVDMYAYQRHEESQVMTFREDYAQSVRIALNKMKEHVDRFGDRKVQEAYLQHVVFYVLLLMLHYVFNAANGWSTKERRAAFKRILDDPMYAYAIRHAHLESFGIGKRISVFALRLRSYGLMKRICAIRDRQLGKTGNVVAMTGQ